MTDCYGPGCRLELPDEGPPWFHSEVCQRNWVESINRPVPLPVPPPAGRPEAVRTVASFELVSTNQHGEPAFRDLTVEVDPDSPVLPLPLAVEGDTAERECPGRDETPPPTPWEELAEARDELTAAVKVLARPPAERAVGWLARALDRLFGRTT